MLNSVNQPIQTRHYPQRHFTAQLFHFQTLASTSTFLKEYAQGRDRASLAGVCALADTQTAGRGRQGRSWHSPPGAGCYFSLLLTPPLSAIDAPLMTLMAAIATAEAIWRFCPRPLDIKWPNDILVNNQKIAGILTEASLEGDRLNYVMLGIGVNLAHQSFPADLGQRATSIYLETNTVITANDFVVELLARIDQWYGVLITAPAGIIERWQHLSSFAYQKKIRVEVDGREIVARTCGLTANGALNLETADGQRITLYGSEITAVED